MTSRTGQDHDPSALEEELVAYLDDELDEEARRRLERRLTEEPTVRESLRKLTRVWDALETLPRAEVSESFATTTVEAVVLNEQQSQANTFGARLRKSRDWWLKTALALAACALFSFIAARLLWPDPNIQLAADLPILENIDAYRSVEGIDFARMLVKENLFPPTAATTATATTPAPDAKVRLAAMSKGEKAAIARNWQKLESTIGGAERERLRALERALKADPDQAELRRVMIRYNDWLGSLKDGQRAALRDLTDPQARLKRMREMILADLPEPDRRVVGDWIEEYARVHEDDLVKRASIPPWMAERFPRLENLDNASRHWLAMGAIMQCMMEPNGREDELPFTEFDFARLEEKLSAEPSKRLTELKDLELKKLALAEWWRTMVAEQFDRPDAGANYAQLFAGDQGLRAEDKNRIFMMSPEDAKNALKREWAMRFGGKQFGRPGGPGGGFGPPPGPPPGERGGGGRRGGGRGRGDRERFGDELDRHRGDEEMPKPESKTPKSDQESNSKEKQQP